MVEHTAATETEKGAPARRRSNSSSSVGVERGGAVSLRPRFVSFAWFGPTAPSFQKAQRANQVPSIFHKTTKTHSSWIAYDESDISEARFAEKLRVTGHSNVSIDFENKRLMVRKGRVVAAVPTSMEEAIKVQATALRLRRGREAAAAKEKADADAEAEAAAAAAAKVKAAAETRMATEVAAPAVAPIWISIEEAAETLLQRIFREGQCSVMAGTADQWHALTDCYGRHCRPVACSN